MLLNKENNIISEVVPRVRKSEVTNVWKIKDLVDLKSSELSFSFF